MRSRVSSLSEPRPQPELKAGRGAAQAPGGMWCWPGLQAGRGAAWAPGGMWCCPGAQGPDGAEE